GVMMTAHRAPSADESDDESQLAETEHPRGPASSFLAHSEHQQLLQEVPHTASFNQKKCNADASTNSLIAGNLCARATPSPRRIHTRSRRSRETAPTATAASRRTRR